MEFMEQQSLGLVLQPLGLDSGPGKRSWNSRGFQVVQVRITAYRVQSQLTRGSPAAFGMRCPLSTSSQTEIKLQHCNRKAACSTDLSEQVFM